MPLSQAEHSPGAAPPTGLADNRPKTGRGAIRPPARAAARILPLQHRTSMSTVTSVVPDVFTAREIARAAGVSAREVRALILAAELGTVDGRFVTAAEAVHAVRLLRGGPLEAGRGLFRPPARAKRSPARAFAASGALHAALLAGLVVLTTMGVASAPDETRREPTHMRLVFLSTPGPGGGGGGGGLRQPAPPPRAETKGRSVLRSPVPPPRRITTRPPDPEPRPTPPVRVQPVARPIEPPRPAPTPAPLPQVVAPVAPVARGRPRSRWHHRGGPEGIRQPRPRDWRRCGDRTGHGHAVKAAAPASAPDPVGARAADRTARAAGSRRPDSSGK